jgi:hypothetical protein
MSGENLLDSPRAHVVLMLGIELPTSPFRDGKSGGLVKLLTCSPLADFK